METKQLLIFRGIPGCGKSYAVNKLIEEQNIPHDQVFSADAFWVQDVEDEYRKAKAEGPVDHEFYRELISDTYMSRWVPERLVDAHEWSFAAFARAVKAGLTPLIVDNVNAKADEMRGYVAVAEGFGYKVDIREPTSQWWLDHVHMFADKQANRRALEEFARFLAGFHSGMSEKYGTRGNQHGAPMENIRRMIFKYQPGLTADDIMMRTDRLSRERLKS